MPSLGKHASHQGSPVALSGGGEVETQEVLGAELQMGSAKDATKSPEISAMHCGRLPLDLCLHVIGTQHNMSLGESP